MRLLSLIITHTGSSRICPGEWYKTPLYNSVSHEQATCTQRLACDGISPPFHPLRARRVGIVAGRVLYPNILRRHTSATHSRARGNLYLDW